MGDWQATVVASPFGEGGGAPFTVVRWDAAVEAAWGATDQVGVRVRAHARATIEGESIERDD